MQKKKKDHCKLLILYWKISHWKLWGLHFFKSYSSIRENGHFIWKSKAENVSWNNKTWYSLIKHDHRNINQITWLISMGKPGWGKTFSYSWFCTHSVLWSWQHNPSKSNILSVLNNTHENFLSNTYKVKICIKSFLAYFMSKHYIAMYCAHHNYFRPG